MSSIVSNIKAIRTLSIFAVLYFLISLGGCGGGTVGSDSGGSTRISGLVQNSTSQSVADAKVTLLETGTFGLTDQNGNFTLDGQLDEGVATFLVERSGFQGTTALNDLPPQPDELTVKLQINTEAQSVAVLESVVKERPTPTATVKPGAAKTPKPIGTPIGPVEPINVFIRIRDLGYLSQFMTLKGNPDKPFPNNERFAVMKTELPATENSASYTLSALGVFFNIGVSGIKAGTKQLDIDLSTHVNFPNSSSDQLITKFRLDSVAVYPTELEAPQAIVTPSLDPAEQNIFTTYGKGVHLTSRLMFDPPELENDLSYFTAMQAPDLPMFIAYRGKGENNYGVVFDPDATVPPTVTLMFGMGTSQVLLADINLVPGARAKVNTVLLITNRDASGASIPLQAQVISRDELRW